MPCEPDPASFKSWYRWCTVNVVSPTVIECNKWLSLIFNSQSGQFFQYLYSLILSESSGNSSNWQTISWYYVKRRYTDTNQFINFVASLFFNENKKKQSKSKKYGFTRWHSGILFYSSKTFTNSLNAVFCAVLMNPTLYYGKHSLLKVIKSELSITWLSTYSSYDKTFSTEQLSTNLFRWAPFVKEHYSFICFVTKRILLHSE